MKTNWLFSPKQDIAFIAGAPIIGYAVFAAMVFGPVAIVPVFSLFLLFILEGPHVFATATRTYLNSSDRESLGKLRLLMILPLCLIGPLFTMAGMATVFYVITVVWLHTHVAKQHVGFLALYKRKAGQFEDIGYETKFFKASLYLPVILFLLKDAAGIKPFLYFGLAYLIPFSYHIAKELTKDNPIYPKLMLFATTVPLQWLAFGYASVNPLGARAAGIVLAFSHTIQYHRLMVAYHSEDAKEIAKKDRKPWHTLAGYAVIVIGINLLIYAFPKGLTDNEIILSAFWGIPFQHYLLDGVIWKTKEYPVFRQAIGV